MRAFFIGNKTGAKKHKNIQIMEEMNHHYGNIMRKREKGVL